VAKQEFLVGVKARRDNAKTQRSGAGRMATEWGLVEGRGKFGVAGMFEKMGYLRGRDAHEGKRGDLIFGEESGVGGFVAILG